MHPGAVGALSMRIRRVRIEEFRKLRGPVVVEGLSEGLTVIAGDNEEGKSTVLEAIRVALFCRHRASGEYVERLVPFGHAGARPRVELDFAIGGTEYRLSKAFCQRPYEAVLTTGGRSFQGDAAEDELCRILGIAAAKRGATRPEEQGVWGLFWVEQGTTFLADAKPGDAGRATIASALEDEMGRVLSGDEGPALLARVRVRCDELFTDSRGIARGDLKLCRERKAEAERHVRELESEVVAYRGKIAELEVVRAERARFEREQVLARAEEERQQAQSAWERLEGLRQGVHDAIRRDELARSRFDAAREGWKPRFEAIKAAKAAGDGEQELVSALDVARSAAEPLKNKLTEAENAVAAARTAHLAAEQAFADAGLGLRRCRARHDLLAEENALRRAETAEGALAAARAAAENLSVDDGAIKALRENASRAGEARARLGAAETELRFSPERGRRVFVGDREITADESLLLSSETTLRLEGFGLLTVRPGGEDLGERQRVAVEAEEVLTELLAKLGLADAAQGEAAYARRRDLLAVADAEWRAVATWAPAGLGALRKQVAERRETLKALSDGMAGDPQLTLDEAQAALDHVRRARDQAHHLLSDAQQRRDVCADATSRAERHLIDLQARHEAAAKLAKERQEVLVTERARIADATLLSTLKDEEANNASAGLLLKKAQDALQACDPEAIAARVEEAGRVVIETRTQIKRLDNQILEREGELRGLGQFGLEEDLAAARDAHDRAARQLAAIERRAAALRLLYDTLREAEAEVKRSFAEPIRRRMAPYLQALFSGTELEFAPDTLQVRHLRRDGLDEPFRHLSVGTREQLAVLTRLAFAELLGERGQPAAVILDDALVYSDRTRLARMQDVLLRAAERLQILVLTCRPDDYARLDVPVVRLAECFVAERVS
jgi:AAA domain